MYRHWHPMYRCSRGASRLVWFVLGAGTATWWQAHKEYHGWYEARHCGRDRIPQNAYPAPGAPPPLPNAQQPAPGQENQQPQLAPGAMDKWDRWGWGHWGKGSWPGQENSGGPWDKWGRNRGGNPRPDGAWGPPTPVPPSIENAPEKDVVQQATDTVSLLGLSP